VKIISFQIS